MDLRPVNVLLTKTRSLPSSKSRAGHVTRGRDNRKSVTMETTDHVSVISEELQDRPRDDSDGQLRDLDLDIAELSSSHVTARAPAWLGKPLRSRSGKTRASRSQSTSRSGSASTLHDSGYNSPGATLSQSRSRSKGSKTPQAPLTPGQGHGPASTGRLSIADVLQDSGYLSGTTSPGSLSEATTPPLSDSDIDSIAWTGLLDVSVLDSPGQGGWEGGPPGLLDPPHRPCQHPESGYCTECEVDIFFISGRSCQLPQLDLTTPGDRLGRDTGVKHPADRPGPTSARPGRDCMSTGNPTAENALPDQSYVTPPPAPSHLPTPAPSHLTRASADFSSGASTSSESWRACAQGRLARARLVRHRRWRQTRLGQRSGGGQSSACDTSSCGSHPVPRLRPGGHREPGYGLQEGLEARLPTHVIRSPASATLGTESLGDGDPEVLSETDTCSLTCCDVCDQLSLSSSSHDDDWDYYDSDYDRRVTWLPAKRNEAVELPDLPRDAVTSHDSVVTWLQNVTETCDGDVIGEDDVQKEIRALRLAKPGASLFPRPLAYKVVRFSGEAPAVRTPKGCASSQRKVKALLSRLCALSLGKS